MDGSGVPFGFVRGDGSLNRRPAPAPSRQRAKLWEMNGSIHGSIIGTCLTTGKLRRVMGKVARRDVSGFTDHELHKDAVILCGQQGVGFRLLQKALNHRHQGAVRQFARLHGEAAVLAGWREAKQAGDIPGAYWALLGHPDVGHAGLRQAFGDVHMLSHLVGAANRADIRRLAAREATLRRLGTLAVVSKETGRKWERQARDANGRCDVLLGELAALEAAGGELLRHDGGQHDHPSLLPGLVSQADRVAFPVDCVSHDAALTVKRICRQPGKAWLPLRSSGVASFVAALSGPTGRDRDLAPQPDLH